MAASIKQKNPGWLEKLIKRRKDAVGKQVAIGFPRGTEAVSNQYPDGTAVLLVAFWNNFGTKFTPRRDFMTSGSQSALEETRDIAQGGIRDINAGKAKAEDVLKKMGVVGASQIQLAIRDLRDPPNKPETIEAKQSSNPLIDTAFMLQSVTWALRGRD